MSIIRTFALSCVFAVACIVATLATPEGRVAVAAEPPKEWDGLQLTPSKKVSRLYVRPGASLKGYKHVRLEPLQVAFDKNWNPNASRVGTNRLTADDFEKIKKALADEFARVWTKDLADAGYDVVTAPGDDVLDVTPLVVDLYISAPDKPTAGRSRTYTADPGRMTLVAELRDSDTGQILARALDAQSKSWTTFQVASSVSNMSAASQIISRWAAALVDALNEANGR
ncbi:MAG TPA: DUF3313 family protein [Steroidobacteraceae bacterium]|nr:DUF3313 family protein [Steroidobacteraceae bacterium]